MWYIHYSWFTERILYGTVQYTTLHYTTLHYTTLHYNVQYYVQSSGISSMNFRFIICQLIHQKVITFMGALSLKIDLVNAPWLLTLVYFVFQRKCCQTNCKWNASTPFRWVNWQCEREKVNRVVIISHMFC